MSRRRSNGFTALLFGLLALAPPALSAGGRSVVTTRDGDYFGFDLRTEQNVSLAQCQSSCIADQECRAFTYNPKVKWCFLKSDFNQLNTFAGAVAGRIIEQGAEPDIGAPQRPDLVSDQLMEDARQQRAGLSLSE
ncbi:MAG: hypothetical protein LDL42_14725, partial [Rhizobium sp.]|nr:hypothetical protein [Rhizobium sp.]